MYDFKMMVILNTKLLQTMFYTLCPKEAFHGSQMNWKMGILNRQGKSVNLLTPNTGKVMEFYPKYWESDGILASFHFFFSDFQLKCIC